MSRSLHKATGITKNQGNMTSPKEHSKLLVTDPQEMEIQELPNKEFKIMVLRMLRVLQKKQLNEQFNEIKETIQEPCEEFN